MSRRERDEIEDETGPIPEHSDLEDENDDNDDDDNDDDSESEMRAIDIPSSDYENTNERRIISRRTIPVASDDDEEDKEPEEEKYGEWVQEDIRYKKKRKLRDSIDDDSVLKRQKSFLSFLLSGNSKIIETLKALFKKLYELHCIEEKHDLIEYVTDLLYKECLYKENKSYETNKTKRDWTPERRKKLIEKVLPKFSKGYVCGCRKDKKCATFIVNFFNRDEVEDIPTDDSLKSFLGLFKIRQLRFFAFKMVQKNMTRINLQYLSAEHAPTVFQLDKLSDKKINKIEKLFDTYFGKVSIKIPGLTRVRTSADLLDKLDQDEMVFGKNEDGAVGFFVKFTDSKDEKRIGSEFVQVLTPSAVKIYEQCIKKNPVFKDDKVYNEETKIKSATKRTDEYKSCKKNKFYKQEKTEEQKERMLKKEKEALKKILYD